MYRHYKTPLTLASAALYLLNPRCLVIRGAPAWVSTHTLQYSSVSTVIDHAKTPVFPNRDSSTSAFTFLDRLYAIASPRERGLTRGLRQRTPASQLKLSRTSNDRVSKHKKKREKRVKSLSFFLVTCRVVSQLAPRSRLLLLPPPQAEVGPHGVGGLSRTGPRPSSPPKAAAGSRASFRLQSR